MKICGSLLINQLLSSCSLPPLGGPPPSGPPPGGPLPGDPPPGGPPLLGDPPPPPGPEGPPGICPPDVPGPYDVDAILVLPICAGAVIVVIMSLDGNGMDSARAANPASSALSGGCTTILSGCLGLLGLLSVYPDGGGHGCIGTDGGVSGGFGKSRYSPALVSLMGISNPRSVPAR